MKVVINCKYGGFGLSYKAVMRYAELKGIKLYAYMEQYDDACSDLKDYAPKIVPYVDDQCDNGYYGPAYATREVQNRNELWENYFNDSKIDRDDLALIQVVEELSDAANGVYAKLKVVEIPNGIDWEVTEYDGYEQVEEVHRSWS